MQSGKYDVTGKTVYLGIDAHLASLQICAVCEGVVLSNFSFPAGDITALIHKLRKLFPGASLRAVYEAGFSGFALQRRLTQAGIETMVVNPGSIPLEARSRVKTDKIDARRLATLLEGGLLRGIRIPSVDEERRRELTRTRDQLVETRKKIGNQIKMKLHFHACFDGKKLPAMSQSFLTKLEEVALPGEIGLVVKALAASWRALAEQIKGLEKELALTALPAKGEIRSARGSHQRTVEIYRSAPGVGPLSARRLADELGDMSQFANERRLSSFSGLTPSQYSSGETRRPGHITRQGSARLRHTLTEVSWRAIRHDAGLRAVYDRIAARRGGKRAIVAVSRRLLGRLRSCLQQDVAYIYAPLSAQAD